MPSRQPKTESQKTAFVISPIGDVGTAMREHADDVFDYIIKPAMEECGMRAVRSDHIAEPGIISQQMLDEILTDDLCIAVITGHNPNVFYELAIAQAASRPVIILVELGEQLPFDVKDLRCVYYDLKPRSLMNKVYVKEVAKQIRALEASGWKGSVPFGKALEPLGHHGEISLLRKTGHFGGSSAWQQVLVEAESTFDIMGIGLLGWRRGKAAKEAFVRKAADGCKIRALLMSPENPALPQLLNQGVEDDTGYVIDQIAKMLALLTRWADGNETFEVRQIRNGCSHWQLTITDKAALCTPYLFSEKTADTPLWNCNPSHFLYEVARAEFEALWRANAVA